MLDDQIAQLLGPPTIEEGPGGQIDINASRSSFVVLPRKSANQPHACRFHHFQV